MKNLRDFHTATPKTGNISKIIGTAVAAAVVGGVVIYGCEAGLLNSPPRPVVTDNELPSPGPLPITPSKTPQGT